MSSIAVMSRMRVNPNHFLPKSLIEAPMWYTSLSMSRKRSCALLNRFTSISGYWALWVNIKLELVTDTLRVDSC